MKAANRPRMTTAKTTMHMSSNISLRAMQSELSIEIKDSAVYMVQAQLI